MIVHLKIKAILIALQENMDLQMFYLHNLATQHGKVEKIILNGEEKQQWETRENRKTG